MFSKLFVLFIFILQGCNTIVNNDLVISNSKKAIDICIDTIESINSEILNVEMDKIYVFADSHINRYGVVFASGYIGYFQKEKKYEPKVFCTVDHDKYYPVYYLRSSNGSIYIYNAFEMDSAKNSEGGHQYDLLFLFDKKIYKFMDIKKHENYFLK